MLDPKLLRSDLSGVAAQLARRGFVLDVGAFAAIEERRKAVQIEADRLRAERNANAKAVGFAKARGENSADLLVAGEALGAQLKGVDEQLQKLQAELADLRADDVGNHFAVISQAGRPLVWHRISVHVLRSQIV